jgi:hypothetical protein
VATARTTRVGAAIAFLAWAQLFIVGSAHAQAAPEPPPAPLDQAAPPPAPPVAPVAPIPPAPQPYSPYAAPYRAPRLRQPMQPYSYPNGPVVRMTSDSESARLQIMQFKWRDVCRAPCEVPVDPRGIYRIGGGTVRPSPSFQMPRENGVVYVDTQVGSTVRHWVGFGLTIGGCVSLAVGGLYLALAQDVSSNTSDPTAKDFVEGLAIFYLVLGGVLTAIGIPLSMSSTSVDVR